jgi:hypothetical protein
MVVAKKILRMVVMKITIRNDRSKRKTAKLLQQFGGAPRFGKRRLHLQTVYQRDLRNASVFL